MVQVKEAGCDTRTGKVEVMNNKKLPSSGGEKCSTQHSTERAGSR
jgi:hypothetical protein